MFSIYSQKQSKKISILRDSSKEYKSVVCSIKKQAAFFRFYEKNKKFFKNALTNDLFLSI